MTNPASGADALTVDRIRRTARRQIEEIERTGTTAGVRVKNRDVVLLSYRGARSGQLHKTPIMRVEFQGSYAAIASLGGAATNPHWFQGLVKHPEASVQDATEVGKYEARQVFGEERAVWWERAVAAYPDYADYQSRTDRQIPVLVLSPIEIR